LGCAKNLVDSEVMLGLLKEKGYEITPHEEDADIMIVNTCAFIDDAKQESVDAILQLVNSNVDSNRKIIVAGCLAQRYRDQLEAELKDDIHGLLGAGDIHHIADACESILAEKTFFNIVSKIPEYLYDHNTPRLRATPKYFAYVKIAEGCDNFCAYCIIPHIRGRFRSRSIESVVAEVKSLAQAGVREVNLIAQDTTYYGRDLRDGTDLPSLLRRLVRIPDIQWIRILYAHPAHINNELLTLIAGEEKVCSYIDIPIQHIHDDILWKMGRQTTQSQIYNLIAEIYKIIPNVTLRTSLIVGFPGETERHFDALMQFVERVQPRHLGVFAYSVEEGTSAADMPKQVPESVKTERLERIAQMHERIATEYRQSLIGQQRVVLVDSVKPQAVGRTQGQAPDIDDVVYIADGEVESGEFVNLEIIDTCGSYDLIGKLI